MKPATSKPSSRWTSSSAPPSSPASKPERGYWQRLPRSRWRTYRGAHGEPQSGPRLPHDASRADQPDRGWDRRRRHSPAGLGAAPPGGRRTRRGQRRVLHPAGAREPRRRLPGGCWMPSPGRCASTTRSGPICWTLPACRALLVAARRVAAPPSAPRCRQRWTRSPEGRRSSATAGWMCSQRTCSPARSTRSSSKIRSRHRTWPATSSWTRERTPSTTTGTGRPTTTSPSCAPTPAVTRTTKV